MLCSNRDKYQVGLEIRSTNFPEALINFTFRARNNIQKIDLFMAIYLSFLNFPGLVYSFCTFV